MKRWILLFFLILLAGLSIWYVSKGYHPSPKEGTFAPAFSLTNSSGKTYSLSDYQGKVVLINFWATWCHPCVSEMASLDRLYQKLKDKNFELLAISVDEGGWTEINEFLKKHPVNFPIVLDSDYIVADQYGTYRVPESYLLDTQGKIVDKILGAQEWDSPEMLSMIQKVLSNNSKNP